MTHLHDIWTYKSLFLISRYGVLNAIWVFANIFHCIVLVFRKWEPHLDSTRNTLISCIFFHFVQSLLNTKFLKVIGSHLLTQFSLYMWLFFKSKSTNYDVEQWLIAHGNWIMYYKIPMQCKHTFVLCCAIIAKE